MYLQKPKWITKAKEATILGNFAVKTVRKIMSYRQDTVVEVYKRKTCLLTDISVLTYDNISVIENEK